jgi:hypothetical protein
MTDSPSYELVQRFMYEAGFAVADPDDEMVFPEAKFMKLASRLIQYGSDQELEACCEWVGCMFHGHKTWSDELRAARRPKPPSLKEQALGILDVAHHDVLEDDQIATIRRALETLPE